MGIFAIVLYFYMRADAKTELNTKPLKLYRAPCEAKLKN